MTTNTLITGGARSGKSNFAQALALKSAGPVLFVATAEAGDEEMRQRIEAHRKARPESWSTLEVTMHVGSQIVKHVGQAQTVIIDCITLLVSNILRQYSNPTGDEVDSPSAEKAVTAEIEELVDCINSINANFIIVTNEVGLGLIPANKMSRVYRDLLGRANQILAQNVDEVFLLVSGIPLPIKPTGPHH
ncbi:bifunctional adenosylcobinamide kinase/adenosylcobinamide-phosphate guanylyltransferase [Chloroflexota bacterium]